MFACHKNIWEIEKTRGAVDLLPLLLLGFITLTTILVVGSVQKQQELRGRAQVYPTECAVNGNYCIPSQEFCDPGDLKGAGGACSTGEVCCQRGAGPRPTPPPSPSPSTLCIDNAGKCVPNSYICTPAGTLPYYTCPGGEKCVGEASVCVPPPTPTPPVTPPPATPQPSPSPLRYACQTNGQCTTTTSTGPNTYTTQLLCVNNCFPPAPTPSPSPRATPSTRCEDNAGRCQANSYICTPATILPYYNCPAGNKCVGEAAVCHPQTTPFPSPFCTNGTTCFYGYSTCGNLGRYPGSGTCAGGICCGNVIPRPSPTPTPPPLRYACQANGQCIATTSTGTNTYSTQVLCVNNCFPPPPTPRPSPRVTPSSACIDNAGKCQPNSYICTPSTILSTYSCPSGQKCVGEAAVCRPLTSPSPTPPSCRPQNAACGGTQGSCCSSYSCVVHASGTFCESKVCDEGVRRCVTNVLQECAENRWTQIQTCASGCNSAVNPPSCVAPRPTPSTRCEDYAGRCWPRSYTCGTAETLNYTCPANQKCVRETATCYPNPCLAPASCIAKGFCTTEGGTVQTTKTCTSSTQECCYIPPQPTPRASPASISDLCPNNAGKCVSVTFDCKINNQNASVLPYSCETLNKCVPEAAVCQPRTTPSPSPKPQIIVPAKCTLSSGEEVPTGTRRCSINTYLRMADRGQAGETLMECSATGEWVKLQDCRVDIGEKCTTDVCSSGTVCEANVACIDTLNVGQAPTGSHSCLGSRGDRTQVMKYCCLERAIFDDPANPTTCIYPQVSPSPQLPTTTTGSATCIGFATCDSKDPYKLNCYVGLNDPLRTILGWFTGSTSISCSPNTCKQTNPLSANCTGPASTTTSTSSFLAGTFISVPAGQMPIEQIKSGQSILAFDPTAKTLRTETVEKVYSYKSSDYFVVTFANGTILRVTGRHPLFIDPDYQSPYKDSLTQKSQAPGFEQVRYLKAGDQIYTLPDNLSTQILTQQTTITAIEKVNHPVQVYNLTVSGSRTYFAQSVAVHNKVAESESMYCNLKDGTKVPVGTRNCSYNTYPISPDREPGETVTLCTVTGEWQAVWNCSDNEKCTLGNCSGSVCEQNTTCIDRVANLSPERAHTCLNSITGALKYCCQPGEIFDDQVNPTKCGKPGADFVYCADEVIAKCTQYGQICKKTGEGGVCCDPKVTDCSADATPAPQTQPDQTTGQNAFECTGTCDTKDFRVINCRYRYLSFLPFTYKYTCSNNRTCTLWGDIADCSGPVLSANDATGTIQNTDFDTAIIDQPPPKSFPKQPPPPSSIGCNNGSCSNDDLRKIHCTKTEYTPFYPFNRKEVAYTLDCGENSCRTSPLSLNPATWFGSAKDCGGTIVIPPPESAPASTTIDANFSNGESSTDLSQTDISIPACPEADYETGNPVCIGTAQKIRGAIKCKQGSKIKQCCPDWYIYDEGSKSCKPGLCPDFGGSCETSQEVCLQGKDGDLGKVVGGNCFDKKQPVCCVLGGEQGVRGLPIRPLSDPWCKGLCSVTNERLINCDDKSTRECGTDEICYRTSAPDEPAYCIPRNLRYNPPPLPSPKSIEL